MGREKLMTVALDILSGNFVMRKERNAIVAGGESEAKLNFIVFLNHCCFKLEEVITCKC